jgi:hypothetical protein
VLRSLRLALGRGNIREGTTMDRQLWGTRLVLVCALAMALSACAADQSLTASGKERTPYPPPGYSHTVQSSHVALYWNCARPDAGIIQVNGLVFNPWSSQPVRYLELELVGVDSRERTVSEAGTKAQDIELLTNQSTPFQVNLRPMGGESRFDLYYRYVFQDGGRDGFLASLAWDGPILFAQSQKQFRVRDACSETLHRVR